MFRMKLLPAGLLAASLAATVSPDSRCWSDHVRPAPARENRPGDASRPAPAGDSAGKRDALRGDPAVADKLKEIDELKQKIEQLRNILVPKAFEKRSKSYRERLEALEKEVDDYARKGNAAVKEPAGLSLEDSDKSDSAQLLTPKRFADLDKLIKPAPGELRWEEIPWLVSVYDARKKAAEEGKPIFLWSGGGSAPLGGC
jgi:hypothetical protein